MYIRRRLGQRRFLIIRTLVSPVRTTKGGGPYVELFLKGSVLGVEVQNVKKAFSLQYFSLAILFDKNCPAVS